MFNNKIFENFQLFLKKKVIQISKQPSQVVK